MAEVLFTIETTHTIAHVDGFYIEPSGLAGDSKLSYRIQSPAYVKLCSVAFI